MSDHAPTCNSCGCESGSEEKFPAVLGVAVVLALAAIAVPDPGQQGLLLLATALAGKPVLAAAWRELRAGSWFNEHSLMSLAVIGAVALGAFGEAAAVMLLYRVGEYLQERAVGKARASVSALLALRPDTAVLLDEAGAEKVVPPFQVIPGQQIRVRSGQRIALDGVVREGRSSVDTSALTGESIPEPVEPGSSVLAGAINRGGMLDIEVTRKAGDTVLARMLQMIEENQTGKAPLETTMRKVARWYTPIMFGLALLVALVPPLLAWAGLVTLTDAAFSTWLYRGLVVLVISCPCALVLSIPLSYSAGVGAASRVGALVKGAVYLDRLNDVETICWDKTGTLTTGDFALQKTHVDSNISEKELLAVGAAAEAGSTHPFAQAFRHLVEGARGRVEHFLETPGLGVAATVGGRHVLAGSDRWMHDNDIEHTCCGDRQSVHVAADGRWLGHVDFADQLRPDTARAVGRLHKAGVSRQLLLSGDRQAMVDGLAAQAGIDMAYGELLPEDKVKRVIAEQADGSLVAFVGDGINDAAALLRSDVGIAMGGAGSDAAVESADIVLINDSPATVVKLRMIAKKTRHIVKQNIGLAFGIKGGFLVAGALGIATMWDAVFADVGVTLLAVLNAMRLMQKVG